MNEQDIQIIKKRSVAGIVALTSRTFILQIVAFTATFLLTIFLTPAVFGIFYVVSAIISFLGYFSDIGLAAALIQKKEDLTREDLVTTFTIQQILVGSVVALAFIFSRPIATFYGLDSAGVFLLRALLVSFFLSSLKTIPSVLLERTLKFQSLIIPQILETVAFYAIAVTLAWQGHGIASFTWAVLARGIVGLVAMYAVSPWRVGLGISAPVARRLMRFGLPFQLNSFLALVKDDLLTIFLGKILTFAEVGYIGWAKKWAEVPLRLIMDSVIRVTFPAFARIQQSKELLGRAIEKTMFGLALTILPISTGLMFFIGPLVGIIPRYGKWEPALFSFSLFVVAAAIASLSTPLTNALNAVGRIKVTLGLMVFWTIATWLLTVLLISMMGFDGFALALVLVSLTIGVVVYLTKKAAAFSFISAVRSPVLGVVVQAAWYALLLPATPPTYLYLGLLGLSGVILYSGVVWRLEHARIASFAADLRQLRS